MKKIFLSLIALIIIFTGILAFTGRKASVPLPIAEIPAESASANIGLDEPFVFNDVTLTAWAVTQDSRCASDVQCIWAGRVTVALRMTSPSGTSSISEIEPGKTVTFEDTAITLDKVSPYPVSTHKIADGEYSFSFRFENLKLTSQ